MKRELEKETKHAKLETDLEPILSDITPNQNLSSREFEILSELIKGGSNKEIAYRLFIDKTTLRSYIKSINKKWNIKGLHNNGNFEAVRTARQQIYTGALERYSNQGVTSSER